MKKMMFSDKYGLTEAVLSGRKTQTRRIIPQSVVQKASEYQLQYFEATLDAISEREAIEQIYFVERLANLPYQVGEVVAVAQCYNDFYNNECDPRQFPSGAGWTNKMFTKSELLPHQIRITNVRIQRLQDISDVDCEKEGIFTSRFTYEYPRLYCFDDAKTEKRFAHETPCEAYGVLIDRISGKGTWQSNPWVFVYDFELVK